MKIYILTDSNLFFGQFLLPFESLNIKRLKELFHDKGVMVEFITYEQVANQKKITNSIIIPTSSQKPYYKEYINDILFILNSQSNQLVPSINMFYSHENKGYQELYKKSIGIKSLKAYYVTTDEINNGTSNVLQYPIVCKQTAGAGSHGVKLIHSNQALIDYVNKIKISFNLRFYMYLKEKVKKIIYKKNYLKKRELYYKDCDKFVLQEFVKNLTYDYKVLIFNDKYYVLKRYIKKGDFRASGSGLFQFEKIEPSLLNYAKNLFEKFNEPMISLDICFDGQNYYLIEFQGTHFGPYTQMFSSGYYRINIDKWEYIEEKIELESIFVDSIYSYLTRK